MGKDSARNLKLSAKIRIRITPVLKVVLKLLGVT